MDTVSFKRTSEDLNDQAVFRFPVKELKVGDFLLCTYDSFQWIGIIGEIDNTEEDAKKRGYALMTIPSPDGTSPGEVLVRPQTDKNINEGYILSDNCASRRFILNAKGVHEACGHGGETATEKKSDLVRTVDTDLIVILIGKFYDIHEKHPEADIWTPFGMGRHFLLIHINNICTSLGERKIELYMMESKSIYVVDTTNKSVRLSYDYYFENIRKVNFESSVFFNIAGVVE
ncbi:hypothetical protein GQR58_011837 [Nymphon striatum]|nr:hypothetical protein GQR58_011837 [Nymphon striatum]